MYEENSSFNVSGYKHPGDSFCSLLSLFRIQALQTHTKWEGEIKKREMEVDTSDNLREGKPKNHPCLLLYGDLIVLHMHTKYSFFR